MKRWKIITFVLLISVSAFLHVYMTSSERASAASTDVILLWDQATSTLPVEWTCISCNPSDPFYQVFPVASSTYGSATSGSNGTHTQLLTFVTSTQGASSTSRTTDVSPAEAPNHLHFHAWNDVVSSASSVIPLHKNLIFIKATNPTSLPKGIIGMFNKPSSTLNSNWVYYDIGANNYLRGDNSTTTSGAANHTHSVATTSAAANNAIDDNANNSVPAAGISHTHNVSSSNLLASVNNAPAYATLVFAKLNATTTMVHPTNNNLIAMFDDATFPTDWTIFSSSTNFTAGRFLVGGQTPGATGGSNAVHNHGGSVSVTSSPPSAIIASVQSDGGSGNAFAGSTSTHGVTWNIDSVNSLPEYRGVILAEFHDPVKFNVDASCTLDDGLLAYYQLEDANDFFNSYHLTASGTVGFVTGKIANAANVTSSGQLKRADATTIDGSSMSFAGWVKINTAPAITEDDLLFSQSAPTSGVSYAVQYQNDVTVLKLKAIRTKRGVAEQSVQYTYTLPTTTSTCGWRV